VNHGKIEAGVRLILQGLNCDTKDRNYAETPERVARAYAEMFEADSDNEYTAFDEEYADFILLRRHKIWSLCPHHLFPVRLIVSVAYLPAGKVLGLSKLARVLNDCNPGPILQEAFTREVVSRLDEIVECTGVACFVEGSHGCMQIRGVKTDGDIVTSAFSGSFLTSARLQDRFFQLITAGHAR
jgi:GTP cyclohydrolase IA